MLQQYMNRELPDLQGRFRKGRGTRDQIANIHWIIKKAVSSRKICFCFIDYAKSFDCVDYNKLWKILKEMGVPDHFTEASFMLVFEVTWSGVVSVLVKSCFPRISFLSCCVHSCQLSCESYMVFHNINPNRSITTCKSFDEDEPKHCFTSVQSLSRVQLFVTS